MVEDVMLWVKNGVRPVVFILIGKVSGVLAVAID
jgi:hypothetical protein